MKDDQPDIDQIAAVQSFLIFGEVDFDYDYLRTLDFTCLTDVELFRDDGA